jgi:hypothetical protein
MSLSHVLPLSDLDFLSDDQLFAYVRTRERAGARREAAQLSAEGAGLVYLKTSHSAPVPKAFKLVEKTECSTGIPQKHEFLSPGVFPEKCFPSNPEAFEIDRDLMRLRRLKKNVVTSARLHTKEAVRGFKPLMVTLTYRPEDDWCPKQIALYLKRIRDWLSRKRPGSPFRYVWVFELTKMGRPHYHVLFWLPKGLTMPKADKRGWWPHGMTKTEWARNAVGYLAKYASKGGDDQVIPKGVRLYGVGGLSLGSRRQRAWWNLPTGVRKWGFPECRWARAFGGGWVCRSGHNAGEWRDSQWVVTLLAGRVFVAPRPPHISEALDAVLLPLLSWPRYKPF